MRNQAAPLFTGISFSSSLVYADIGGISSINLGIIGSMFSKVFESFAKLLAIQQVRVILSLIALAVIFYNLLDSILGKINQLAASRKPIAIALSALSLIALFKTLSVDRIDKLGLTFLIVMIVVLLFKGFIKLKNYFSSETNHRRVIKEEKRERNDVKEEGRILDYFQSLNDKLKQGILNVKKELEEGRINDNEAEKLLESLEKELEELNAVYNLAAKRRGGM